MKIHLAPTVPLLLQLLVAIPKVKGDYELSVTIISYNNSGKVCIFCLSGGINGCCDGSSCGNCDNIFHYCLREFGSTSTRDHCQYMEVVSGMQRSSSEMDFNSSFILSPSNPITVQGISTQWTGVQLLMNVSHGSYFSIHGNHGVGGASDRFHINIEGTMPLNTLVTDTYQDINHMSIIQLSYQISCSNGPNCFDHCLTADCGPGTCVSDSTSYSYTCMCPSDHFGDACNGQDYCHGVDCNRGTCETIANGYRCNCDLGFSGSACEIGLCSNYCMNGGTCVLKGSSPKCNCHSHYSGTWCELIDYCADVECSRNGHCEVIGNSYTCKCNPGFTSVNCEVTDHCDGIDCGKGTCVNVVRNFSCECMDGYTGELCEAECENISCSSEVPDRGLVLLDLVKIVGGVGGVLVVAVLLLLMILMIIVVRRTFRSRKKSAKSADQGKKDNKMPKDNPISMLVVNRSERTYYIADNLSSNVHLGENRPVRDGRLFLNPIYGDRESDDYEAISDLNPATTTSTFEVPRSGGIPCSVNPAAAPASYEVPRSGGMPRSMNPASASEAYEVPRSGGVSCIVNPAAAPASYEVPRSDGMTRSPDWKVRLHGPYPLPYEKPISRITRAPQREDKDPVTLKKLPTSPQLWKKPMLPPVPARKPHV